VLFAILQPIRVFKNLYSKASFFWTHPRYTIFEESKSLAKRQQAEATSRVKFSFCVRFSGCRQPGKEDPAANQAETVKRGAGKAYCAAKKVGQLIVVRDTTHSNTKCRKDDYAFFLRPVDVANVPGYSDVVSRPMDLGTMSDKVNRGKYRSLEDFAVSRA